MCIYICVCTVNAHIYIYRHTYTKHIRNYISYTEMYTGLLVSLKNETVSWNHRPKYSHMSNAEYWWLSH